MNRSKLVNALLVLALLSVSVVALLPRGAKATLTCFDGIMRVARNLDAIEYGCGSVDDVHLTVRVTGPNSYSHLFYDGLGLISETHWTTTLPAVAGNYNLRFTEVTTNLDGSTVTTTDNFPFSLTSGDVGGATPTPAPTATPKPTPAPTATPKPTPAPTATPKSTPAPTATPKSTQVPTASPRPTAAPAASNSADQSLVPSPSATAAPSISSAPSARPSSTPVATPGASASALAAVGPIGPDSGFSPIVLTVAGALGLFSLFLLLLARSRRRKALAS